MAKKKILALFDHFYPAVKSGGPAKSSLGFAERLAEYFEIRIYTSDRDYGDQVPYKNIVRDNWLWLKGFEVFYASSKSRREFVKMVDSFKPDFIYINSLFSLQFSIRPLLALKQCTWKGYKVILAPRGELARGALEKGRIKKWLFLRLYPWLLEWPGTVYQASSEFEATDIKKSFKGRLLLIARNLRPPSDFRDISVLPIHKMPGTLRICLFSRINQVKNIHLAIQWIKDMDDSGIQFDIYGFKEDQEYFDKCTDLLKITSRSTVQIMDGLESDKVIPALQQHHLFLLPTLGENFGHSILESFMAGRPVLISDQTPWRNLSATCSGLDLPLDGELIKEKIRFFLDMDDMEYQFWSQGARTRAEIYFNDPEMINPYLTLFQ